ncbi:MAG: efflux RND transporter periplasmic adaptor subunit [Planctomycetota bacterium]
MKIVIVVIGLGLLGGATAFLVNRDSVTQARSEVPAEGLYSVHRGDLTISITENGTLVAKDSQKITPKIRGNAKIATLVEEGKSVAESEVVCELDSTEQMKEVERLELDLLSAAATLETARTDLEIQETENLSAIEKAKMAFEKAEKELERYKEGESPQKRSELEIAITDAEKQFLKASKRLEDSKLLRAKDFISQSQLEDDELNYYKAQVQKERAESDLRMFQKYSDPMAIAEKEATLVDARRDMGNAEKRASSQINQKKVAVTQAEKRHLALDQQLAERKEEIANMTLKAPCPGIVIYGDPRGWYDPDNIKVGGQIWQGMTILTIPDLRVMQVRLQVHEADINKIKVGLPAKVTMDTYPGLVLEGEVSKVAAIAEGASRPWSSGAEVKKFDVEITLHTEEGLALKPGVSAKAEIFVEKKEGVIFVPLQCVFVEEGIHKVYVMGEGNAPAPHDIKPGANNDSFIEILEGLEEGEKVLLYNPSLASSGKPEKEAGPLEKDAVSSEAETPPTESAGEGDL